MMLHKIKKIFFLVVIFQTSHVYCMEGSQFRAAQADYAKRYPLHGAARDRNCAKVQRLLLSDANVNGKDDDGHTPLHVAALNLHTKDIVSILFANGADANVRNNCGNTPLHCAFEDLYGDKEVVSILLANGADIEAKNNDGSTPLHNACDYEKNRGIARILFSEAFSTKSPKSIEESRDKAAQNIWVFEQFGEKFGKTYDLPLPLKLLILSKLPERICSAEMVDAIVPLIAKGDDLVPIIEACSDEWLMRSEKFRTRMGGDEQAANAIADVRAKQTEPLLKIRNLNGSTPVDRMPELGSAAFKTKVRDGRLARLAAYLHKSEEIKI